MLPCLPICACLKSTTNKLLGILRMELCDHRLSSSLLLACCTSLLHLCLLQLLRKCPQDAKAVLPTAKCLLPCWIGPSNSCGPLHFHILMLVCMLCANLHGWGLFLFYVILFLNFFSFSPFSQSLCITGRMKKEKKYLDVISSLATIKLSHGFAEEFGVLMFRTSLYLAVHCAPELQFCN